QNKFSCSLETRYKTAITLNFSAIASYKILGIFRYRLRLPGCFGPKIGLGSDLGQGLGDHRLCRHGIGRRYADPTGLFRSTNFLHRLNLMTITGQQPRYTSEYQTQPAQSIEC